MQIDPINPQIVYAALWESREGPWENGVFNGNGGGIFKSVDGGKTWRQLSKGLPDNIVQANLAIAPSEPKTLFAAVKTKTIAKLYRSDDGGETWHGTTDDPRPGLGIGGAICRRGGSTRKIRRSFTRPASFVGNRQMAEKSGMAGAARPAATIIKTFGLVRTIPTSSAGLGSGRGRHGERRQELEFVAQRN